jgi:hypothetical protein
MVSRSGIGALVSERPEFHLFLSRNIQLVDFYNPDKPENVPTGSGRRKPFGDVPSALAT